MRPPISSTSPPKATAPKGIFPWYAPGYDSFLGEFPLSHDAIKLPAERHPTEPADRARGRAGLRVNWAGDTVVSLQPFALGAFNDCSIRRPERAEDQPQEELGPGVERRCAQFFDISDLTPDGPTADAAAGVPPAHRRRPGARVRRRQPAARLLVLRRGAAGLDRRAAGQPEGLARTRRWRTSAR